MKVLLGISALLLVAALVMTNWPQPEVAATNTDAAPAVVAGESNGESANPNVSDSPATVEAMVASKGLELATAAIVAEPVLNKSGLTVKKVLRNEFGVEVIRVGALDESATPVNISSIAWGDEENQQRILASLNDGQLPEINDKERELIANWRAQMAQQPRLEAKVDNPDDRDVEPTSQAGEE